jgi:serine/threonine-protein kinase
MAEGETKPHWWQTLPAILSGIAAVIAAITGLLALGQNNLLPWQPRQTEKSTPTTTSPTAVTDNQPPVSIPGTDARGFLPPSHARCDPGHPAVAMGVTTQSVLVVCQTGPGAFYYRAVRFSDGAPADLANAVRSSVGFDVKNPVDDTRYEIRPDRLTIRIADGRVEASYPMTAYWPR